MAAREFIPSSSPSHATRLETCGPGVAVTWFSPSPGGPQVPCTLGEKPGVRAEDQPALAATRWPLRMVSSEDRIASAACLSLPHPPTFPLTPFAGEGKRTAPASRIPPAFNCDERRLPLLPPSGYNPLEHGCCPLLPQGLVRYARRSGALWRRLCLGIRSFAPPPAGRHLPPGRIAFLSQPAVHDCPGVSVRPACTDHGRSTSVTFPGDLILSRAARPDQRRGEWPACSGTR